MKALVIRGKEQMTIEERPDPVPKDDEVLISPKYVGICGSDIHYYFNGANGVCVIKGPFTPGHEFSGVLVSETKIDEKVYPKGARVAIHPAIWGDPVAGLETKREIWPNGNYYGSAAHFPHCDGGMRTLMAVKKYQLRILPDQVSLEAGSLAEPLAVALHGISFAPDIKGKQVLVSGAGPIGLLTAVSCVLKGANVTVSDVLAGPLKRAKALGVETVINLGNDEEVPANKYDVIFECSGSPAGINTAVQAATLGGTIIQVGMIAGKPSPLNFSQINNKELTYKGSLRFDKEFDEAITMLAKHHIISNVITHTYPATKAIEAFEMAKNSEESGKVVISFDSLS